MSSKPAAVVTGGASGLGEATARALAAQGVKVAIFDMNEAKGEEVAREIGGVFCKVNVTSDADVDAGFDLRGNAPTHFVIRCSVECRPRHLPVTAIFQRAQQLLRTWPTSDLRDDKHRLSFCRYAKDNAQSAR